MDTTSDTQTPKTFRLVSLDGGDGRITAHLLYRLRAELMKQGNHSGDFLSNVDMFCGVSAGGINSLLLANQDRPDDLVNTLPGIWNDLNASLMGFPGAGDIRRILETGPPAPFLLSAMLARGILTRLMGLLGWHSLLSNQGLRSVLEQHFCAVDSQTNQSQPLKLSQLKKAVAVTAFQLDNESTAPAERRWAPRVFTNLPDSEGSNELCLDVALRTSAQPVELPIFQSLAGTGPGFIDGGYVANNPAMVGIARLVDQARQAEAIPEIPHKVLVLSIGAGVRNFFPFGANYLPSSRLFASDGSAPWGFGLWLFNPLQPLLLANIFLQSASAEVVAQVRGLLGAKNVCRIDPPVADSRMQSSAELTQTLSRDPNNDLTIKAAVTWMETSGWLDTASAAPPVKDPTPAGPSAPTVAPAASRPRSRRTPL